MYVSITSHARHMGAVTWEAMVHEHGRMDWPCVAYGGHSVGIRVPSCAVSVTCVCWFFGNASLLYTSNHQYLIKYGVSLDGNWYCPHAQRLSNHRFTARLRFTYSHCL